MKRKIQKASREEQQKGQRTCIPPTPVFLTVTVNVKSLELLLRSLKEKTS